MTISKHHNHNYSGGIPLACGDRYYAQDLGRDFNYLNDRLGLMLKDSSNKTKMIVSGGVVSQVGGQDKINVTALVGYVPFSVDVPGTWAIPPTPAASDINLMRVAFTAITNFDISATATLNGSATNYVKVSYVAANLNSRSRAKKAGTYYYELAPSYILTCDTVAPTAYELCLGEIVSAGGGAAMTITTAARTSILSRQIYTTTLTTVATTLSIPIPENYGFLKVFISTINSSGGTCGYRMHFNSDTGAAYHFGYDITYYDTSTRSQAGTNGTAGAYIALGEATANTGAYLADLTIAQYFDYKLVTGSCNYYFGGTALLHYAQLNGAWNKASTVIDNINLVASAANGFGIGTKITIEGIS